MNDTGIKKFSIQKDEEKTRILKDKKPHPDFVNSLEGLSGIFQFHMGLEGIPESRIRVVGIEDIKSTDFGYGYKIMAVILCHSTGYKLTTFGLFPRGDDFFDSTETKEQLRDFMDEKENMLIEKAFGEAFLYIEGKRAPDNQPTFSFDDEAEEGGND